MIKTLRAQLIVGVTVVHAALMVLFIWDLTKHKKTILLEQQTEQAIALAQSVSSVSGGWLAARDYSGLQEIAQAQLRHSELTFAIILDKQGKIIAHSDTTYIGQYLDDIPKSAHSVVLSRTAKLVDVASPIVIAQTHIGWVRIGMGQEHTMERLSKITRNGIIYGVLAILLGAILAGYMGTQLTRKLNIIRQSAKAVQRGDLSHRVTVNGSSEVGAVADALNSMLDTLHESKTALEENKQQLQLIIDSTAVGIWDWRIDTNEASFNERWAEIIGYSLKELEPLSIKTWLTFAHPDDLKESKRLLNEYWQGKSDIYHFESRMKHKSGHWVWIQDTGKVVEWSKKGDPIRMIGTHLDITAQKNLENKLRQQAMHDSLTQLANRQQFELRATDAIEDALSNKVHGLILFIDLDRFKPVNDIAGHAAGDKLLQNIADIFRRHIRNFDLLARIGGDEFALLLENCPIERGEQIAQAMRKEVENLNFTFNGHNFTIGMSAGIASFGDIPDTLSSVMNAADNACQIAKHQGRNRIYTADPDKQDYKKQKQLASWIQLIDKALCENTFILYAQQIYPLNTSDQNKHYELLVRMQQEDGSIIPPGAFIPSAERYDLMIKIDFWVLREAFKSIKPNTHYSINLSGQSMADQTLVLEIQALVERYHIEPNNITFEITETAAIQNIDKCLMLLRQLRKMGFLLSLDDFGSGLSSFNYLKQLPIDILKIDGAFVKDIGKDKQSYAIVKSIHEVGRTMGLKTVAEFVEDEQTMQLLVEIGVDYAQGYHVHKPQPLTEISQQ